MNNEEFQKLVLEQFQTINNRLGNIETRQDEIYQVVRAIEHSNNVGKAELDDHNIRLAKNEGTLKKIAKVIDEELNKASNL
ncbi:UNVERIFIED_CONTAM: hypothetical protein Cloal_2486 [Acetivibrio alkalicellulosi]